MFYFLTSVYSQHMLERIIYPSLPYSRLACRFDETVQLPLGTDGIVPAFRRFKGERYYTKVTGEVRAKAQRQREPEFAKMLDEQLASQNTKKGKKAT